MKRFLSLVLALMCAPLLYADMPPVPEEEAFHSIFDGESLDGWVVQGMENAGPRIRDGGLMEMTGWDYWAVITEDEYKDFALRLEFRVSPRGNSGILIHTPKKEVFKHAIEIQISDDDHKANADDKRKTGAIYDHVAPEEIIKPKPGQWYEMEIVFLEGKLWVRVDDTLLQDGVDLEELEIEQRTRDKGSIAIQRNDLRKGVFFRNLRIFPYDMTGTENPEALKDETALE